MHENFTFDWKPAVSNSFACEYTKFYVLFLALTKVFVANKEMDGLFAVAFCYI